MACSQAAEWTATCFFQPFFHTVSYVRTWSRFKYDLCEVYSSISSPASLHLSLASACAPWWSSFHSLTPAAMQTLHFSLDSHVLFCLFLAFALSLSPSPFFSLCWWSYFESQATSLLLMISSSWTSVKLASSSRSQLHYKPLTKSSHASDKI